MADVSHFNIKIAVDSKSGQAEVVKFGKAASESMDKLEKSAKSANSSMLSFSTLIKGAGVAAVGMLGASMVKGAAELENYGVQFEVLTGSAEKGKKLFEDIRKFGAATPFETTDLASSVNTMLGFNVAQEQVMGNLSMLGDIAMGNAEKLKSLSLVFSQVSANGKLSGEDLAQMIDAGYNPLVEISKKTGKTIGELREEVSKGKISFEDMREAMKAATSEGGQFYKMSEKMSMTFDGLLSTLKDTIGTLIAEAGAPLLQLMKTLLPAVVPIVEALGSMLGPIIKALVPVVESLIPPLKRLLDGILKALAPLIEIVSKNIGKLTPIFNKLIIAASKIVEALAPMIDMFAEMATDQLDKLIPLLDAVLTLFIAISPAITLMSTVTANLIKVGMGLMTSVVWPLKKAIEWIIYTGAKAADIVASIFGGGGNGAKGGSGGGAQGGEKTAGAGADATTGDGKPKPPPVDPKAAKAAADKAYDALVKDIERRQKLEEARLEASHATEKMIYDSWKGFQEEKILAAIKYSKDYADLVNESAIRSYEEAASLEQRQVELAMWALEQKQAAKQKEREKIEEENAKIQASQDRVSQSVINRARDEEEATKARQDAMNTYSEIVSNIGGALAIAAEENFYVMKGIALAETIINTAKGVMAASPNVPLMYSIGALGAAQIAKIILTKPGSASSGSSAPTGLAESGSAPSGGAATPRRLNLSGAGQSMPTEIKLRAEGGDLIAAFQFNTRRGEGMAV